ncbi:hypothetical protein A500_10235 [Clostridium sartagoforme AAU1]|uniref:Antibiotic biosynthesis monooxygenase n=1 Tax=Clostridium sartagoforme AAU1 TaxID=1202534 RepID=R9C7Z1_9CLOT|nr:hypothetical protein [Clostridium sartagoforme]EOR25368.1 hypothetical protein A500_10235 [Clostridium sartagoforme AAU1]
MISRTWHGIVPIEMKENFKNHLEITGVKDTISISGNKGAFVKIVDQGNYTHFFLCTLWDKMESVILYAGENPEVAVTYPEDEKYGLISDPIVIHQEVKIGKNPF